MSAIPFTDRELIRAWRDLSSIVNSSNGIGRTNPQRLLLFYAVECGLKAVWLKRKSRTLFDKAEIDDIGHDLRGLMTKLNIGNALSLPSRLSLKPVRKIPNPIQRNGSIEILHQVWRYGGTCLSPTDDDCETKLMSVLQWIEGELK